MVNNIKFEDLRGFFIVYFIKYILSQYVLIGLGLFYIILTTLLYKYLKK